MHKKEIFGFPSRALLPFFGGVFGADGAVYLGGTLSRLDARVSGAPRGICRVAVIEL